MRDGCSSELVKGNATASYHCTQLTAELRAKPPNATQPDLSDVSETRGYRLKIVKMHLLINSKGRVVLYRWFWSVSDEGCRVVLTWDVKAMHLRQ